MNWEILNKEYNINNNSDINSNNKLNNYELISRNNLENLSLGMHIKYSKSEYDSEKNIIIDKIYNGGFLINILNTNKIVNLILVLKSNIIWKLRFIKFKIYAKKIENFTKPKINIIKDDMRNRFKNEIEIRKKKLIDEQDEKIAIILLKKNKYNINI